MSVPNEAVDHLWPHRAQDVQHDHYAVAAASLELGLLHLKDGRLMEAEQILEKTKAGKFLEDTVAGTNLEKTKYVTD